MTDGRKTLNLRRLSLLPLGLLLSMLLVIGSVCLWGRRSFGIVRCAVRQRYSWFLNSATSLVALSGAGNEMSLGLELRSARWLPEALIGPNVAFVSFLPVAQGPLFAGLRG
jgi:hypothetical protein